ncbi:MAG: sodium-translocating pyrophosphatase [Thermoplasmata archaeon]|nr:sodium-translocating pyrophosphatase [Thermoplasmata archaeon]
MMEYLGVVTGLVALLTASLFALYVRRRDPGEGKMVEISNYIRRGAMAFLNREYRSLIIFIIVVSALLFILSFVKNGGVSHYTSLSFVVGAILSALSGNVGMRIATLANVRTAKAVEKDIHSGLKVAFSSGAVMGLTVVGLGLSGISLIYLIFSKVDPSGLSSIMFGFGFGASSIALFARVGGGIYTKAADVGADLVGKVEAGIPEDDPRNPAVIADNVGDNVGDVAGMGADLFESYVDSIIAAIAIGVTFTTLNSSISFLPLIIAGIGILSSIIGIAVVVLLRNRDPTKAMNSGVITSSIVMIVLSSIVLYLFRDAEFSSLGSDVSWYSILGAIIAGLVAGIIIGFSTEYYTSDKYNPTRKIAKASTTGAATTIIEGMAVGMLSTVIPVISVVVAIIVAYILADLYGIAIAAVGMLSTLGMTLSMDTYGPVADNAAGIAEMAGLGKNVRERAEELDAVGNTTAAIGKGFAIGSAALTALALFATYNQSLSSLGKQLTLSLSNPSVIAGIFIGALMPFLFSALALSAVGDAAEEMVNEVRRQFREIKGIMEGKATPDYEKCVDISTKAAIRKMVLPTLLAIIVPVVVGVIPQLGPEAVGGVLAGSIASGFLLAIYMANSGGAWDNAKKYIEKGNLGGKGSEAHKAAVVGDTVGDPLKDTAGPSLNILIKLMSIVSLIFAPLFVLLL